MIVEMLRLKTLGIGMMSPCLDDLILHGDRQFQPGKFHSLRVAST